MSRLYVACKTHGCAITGAVKGSGQPNTARAVEHNERSGMDGERAGMCSKRFLTSPS